MKDNKGHLLINLLVVVSIISLLSAITIPYLKKYQTNLKLNGSARNLASDLRLAQQLTVTEQKIYAVHLDVINDSYQIIKIDVSTTTIKFVNLDNEVDFQDVTGLTDNNVVFNFYGAVSEPGQIILINTNNKVAEINVKPSGYIQLTL